MINNNNDLFGADVVNRGSGEEFLIVGLGASAGGIHALKEFFLRVPADSGMAYVVILHLSPDHESRLAEVLQSAAAIPVSQVTDQVPVAPNHVYVISPNQSLSMKDGHLSLSEMTRIEERRAPVDIFFRTLAESHHSRAVCVILSGTGANGSMGMKRVKECGGICLVQSPDEAQYADMPRNCIATGLVDYVLPVAEIPAKIIAYKNHLGSVSIPAAAKDRREADDQALREIFTLMRQRTGQDFTDYKRSTVLRRIERRISVHELPNLPAYAECLRHQADEARALLKDLLISVTNFYRDPESFEVMERLIIPRLFQDQKREGQIRVWVAGCATGEEAYSMAMLLSEYSGDSIDRPVIQVFATDIDEWAISKARDGYYTLNDAADVSPGRLQRFFVREGEGYRVRAELREIVLFANHNLIKDPPFSHLDLVTCSNLLIYLNRVAQKRTMEVLHFALKPEGYLFLGMSESIEGASDLFVVVDKERHIYQSRPVQTRVSLPIPAISLTTPVLRTRPEDRVQETAIYERLSYLDLHQRLLEEYGPPSVVINQDYEIVHLSPSAGRYLQFPAGEPSTNLLKVIRPEIRLELRTALYEATQRGTNTEARQVLIQISDRTTYLNLIVRPVVRPEDTTRGFILVLFEEVGGETPSEKQKEVVNTTEPIARHLEEELMRVRAQLRATSEQHDLQQEELKASNEELQAINEELRSAAEELETSKEELQSVNEELTTVNQELKIKIDELSQTNNDFQNLINSTDIGTIFLDRSMRVKFFTPRACDIFNFIPTDLGRPLSDITTKLEALELSGDIERVLDKLQPVNRELETSDGRQFMLRILPYRTAEDQINGVVLTFLDITEASRAKARRVNEVQANQALLQANKALKEANDAREQVLGKLVRAQEDERRKIARDLHDQLGQQLTALRLQLEILKARLVEDARAYEQIEQTQVIVRRIESDIDFLAWELRPLALDDVGLQAALNDHIQGWSRHTGISVEFRADGFKNLRLAPEIETNLYRIALEALNNIRKHARASSAAIILEVRDDRVALIVEDNGTGFDIKGSANFSDGMGIMSIRERVTLIGGALEIESEPKKGTTLFARVPARFVETSAEAIPGGN